jgi:hypothetical protein
MCIENFFAPAEKRVTAHFQHFAAGARNEFIPSVKILGN